MTIKLKQDNLFTSNRKRNGVISLFKKVFYCIELESYQENFFFHSLQMSITFLQMTACSILIATRATLIYDQVDYFMRLIRFIASILTLSPDNETFSQENLEQFCNFGLILLLSIFGIGILCYIGSIICLMNERGIPTIILGTLAKFSVLHPTIIYLPLLLKGNSMIKSIIDKPQIVDKDIAALVFLIIGGLLNLFLALFHIIRFSKIVNYSTVGAVRTRVPQIFTILCNFISASYYIYISKKDENSLAADISLAILGLSALLIYSKYMPEIQFEDNKFPLTILAINLSFCSTLLYYHTTSKVKNASFIFIPFFLISSMILIKIVYHFLLNYEFNSMVKSIYTLNNVEAGISTYSKINSIFKGLKVLDIEQHKYQKQEIQAWGILNLLSQFFKSSKSFQQAREQLHKETQLHTESHSVYPNPMVKKQNLTTEMLKIQDFRTLARQLQIEFLIMLNQKFQNNPRICLELIARQVQENQTKNLYAVLTEIEKMSKKIPNSAILDIIKNDLTTFIVNERKQKVDQDLDLYKVFQMENYFSELYSLILEESGFHQKYWKSLSLKEVSGITLQRSSQNIVKIHKTIDNLWQKVEQNGLVKPHGIRFHLLYGIYNSILRNDPFEAHKSLDSVLQLRQQQQVFSNLHPGKFDLSIITCDEMAMLMVSSNHHQLGQIKFCNTGVIPVLGYQPNRLIGRKINAVLPKFIAQKHDNFLKDYIEHGKSELINKSRRLFIVNSNNYISKVLAHVQILPFSTLGGGFLGLLKKEKESKEFFLIDYETLEIIGSEFAYEIFSLDQSTLNTISNICSNFIENLNKNLKLQENERNAQAENSSQMNIAKNEDRQILTQTISDFAKRKESLQMNELKFFNAKTQSVVYLQDVCIEFDLFQSSRVLVIEFNQGSQSENGNKEDEEFNNDSTTTVKNESLFNSSPIIREKQQQTIKPKNQAEERQFQKVLINDGDKEAIISIVDTEEDYKMTAYQQTLERTKTQTKEDDALGHLMSSKRGIMRHSRQQINKKVKLMNFRNRMQKPLQKKILLDNPNKQPKGLIESSQRASTFENLELHKKLKNELSEHYSPLTVKMLGYGLFILMISALPINIWIYFYSKSLITNVFDSVEVNKYAEQRYEQYIEVLRRVKLAEIVKKGYIDRYTRHAVMNVPDYIALLRGRIARESKALLLQNNLLQEKIHKLDKSTMNKFFQDSFSFDYQDKIDNLNELQHVEMNIFEAVQELGYLASKLEYQSDYDINNPNHKFVMRNGNDKLLQNVQKATVMIRDYKSNLISEYIRKTVTTQTIVIVLGVAGLIICLIINTFQYQSTTIKIYESLIKIKQTDVEKFQQQCVALNQLLQTHQNDQISDKIQFWDYSKISYKQLVPKSNSKNSQHHHHHHHNHDLTKSDYRIRKTLSVKNLFLKTMQEVLMILMILIVYATLVVIFIILAQVFKNRVLHMFDRQGNAIDELSYIGVQISAVYQGIADDGKGSFFNKPINTIVNEMNNKVGDIDQFFNNFTVDGINILPNYRDLLLNDICPYAIPVERAYCEKDAINKKGLFGQKSYYSLTLSEIYNQYLQSNRSEQAKTEAFSHIQLPEIERVYYITTRPAFKELQSQTQGELNQYLNDYPDKILVLTVITVILYIIIPLIVYRPIVKKIKLSYDILKDVLKPMPEEVILENKQLLFYLEKISPISSKSYL